MAIANVQIKSGTADDTTSISITPDSNVTAGNLLVIYATKYAPSSSDNFVVGDLAKSAGTSTIGTITMDIEAKWTVSGEGFAAVYSVPVTGTGTITLTLSSIAGSWFFCVVQEVSGADTSASRVAGTNSDGTDNTSPYDSGTVALTGGGMFAGCIATLSISAITFTEDAAFTLAAEQESVDHMTGAAAYRIVTGTTTDSATWTASTNDPAAIVLAVYKEGAASHALTANNITTGAPSVGSPTIGQTHALTASALTTGSPTLGTPSLAGEAALTANSITTGAPALGTPSIGQVHALTASGITTGAPAVGSPSMLGGVCIAGLLAVSSNPLYLENSQTGVIVFLSGHHTWYNVQDGGDSDPPAAFDFDEFLDSLVDNGANATKLWASMESAQNWADPGASGFNPQYFRPERYERSGTSGANDGGNKFDLTSINQDFLDRLRARAIALGNAGIYCIVQLFQGWQIEDKGGAVQPFDYHPYNSDNNINSVDGDFNSDGDGTETHTDTNNAAWSYQQDFIEAVVTLLNDLDHIIYEVSNEDTGSTANTNWQEAVIDHIQSVESGLDKQHLVMRTVAYPSGSNTALDASDAQVVSYNADKADGVVDGDKVSLYDTDHTFGITDTVDWIFQALCNGHAGTLYMDLWDGALYGTDTRADSTYNLIRRVLGDALSYADQIDLENAAPNASLSTTNYLLGKTTGTDGKQIISYQPGSGSWNVNLSSISGVFALEWYRVSTGETQSGGTVNGGDNRTLTPPWTGKVAAFLVAPGTDALTANGITTGTPAIGTPTAGHIHNLSASGVTTGSPDVGSPAIGQVHVLTADGITVSAPTIGEPTAAHIHVLSASGVTTGAPSIGTPAIGQVHALTAGNIVTGNPAIGTPSMSGEVALSAENIVTGAPSVGSPAIGQIHGLSADGIATNAPALGAPTLAENVHSLTASNLYTGTPTIASPVIGQVHVLTASGVTTGSPSLGAPAVDYIEFETDPSVVPIQSERINGINSEPINAISWKRSY